MRATALTAATLCLTQMATAQEVSQGTGALLRGVDKVDGQISNFDLGNGATAELGRLTISLRECRYPAGNPSGDAFAFLTVREQDIADPIFQGWVFASSPALNALEHPRYDVWVLRCKTE